MIYFVLLWVGKQPQEPRLRIPALRQHPLFQRLFVDSAPLKVVFLLLLLQVHVHEDSVFRLHGILATGAHSGAVQRTKAKRRGPFMNPCSV